MFEIAEINVKAGGESAFEAAAQEAVPLFRRARGCRGMELQRTIEVPTRYRLVVQWDSFDDHMVHFRGSADFQEWRRLVGGYFTAPPAVEHTRTAFHGF